jgi:hypothetical protein
LQDWSSAVQLLLEACSKLAMEELAKVSRSFDLSLMS